MPPLVRKHKKKVVIFSDSPDWHAKNLKDQLSKKNLDARFVSLSGCRINTCNNCGAISLSFSDTCMSCGGKLKDTNKESKFDKNPSERTIEVKAEEVK